MTRKRGATFIELLMAVTIFAVAILALFGTFSLSLRLTGYSKNITVASNTAQEIIDQLRLGGFDNAALNANPTAVAVPKLPRGFSKTYIENYQGNDKIKQVTVKVYWSEQPESKAITLITLIGQGGVSG